MNTTTDADSSFSRRGGRPRRYPWEQWLALPRTLLVAGADYGCGQASFGQQLRNAAAKLGVGVHVADLGDRFLVVRKDSQVGTGDG